MPAVGQPIPTIACPSCGTLFKWKADLAGRKPGRRCGVLMRMPPDPTGRATMERATVPPPDESGGF